MKKFVILLLSSLFVFAGCGKVDEAQVKVAAEDFFKDVGEKSGEVEVTQHTNIEEFYYSSFKDENGTYLGYNVHVYVAADGVSTSQFHNVVENKYKSKEGALCKSKNVYTFISKTYEIDNYSEATDAEKKDAQEKEKFSSKDEDAILNFSKAANCELSTLEHS